MSELTLGGTVNEAIDFAMNNYQRSKTAAREAEKTATEKNHKDFRRRSLDMGYWEQRMLAAGAMGLEVATPPDAHGGVGNHRPPEYWEDQIAVATAAVWQLEEAGLPFFEAV